ncbi:unnamed protein product [Clonostachys rosea]|uniref:Peptidase M43 pregnancy-associated plasma-A domain-containing protein n=1 Tax=Bionectria ochroleuca TaxID=29856 RepID=A0ABY6UL42_BIOOC|nr:unnamed protein product [Clonostachys rosea]
MYSIKSVLLFAGAALGHSLSAREDGVARCGTAQPSAEFVETSREFSVKEASARLSGLSTTAALSVDVYLHSVSGSTANLLSDATLQAQFDVLYDNFSPYGITLNYAGSSKTVNSAWSQDRNELTMKRALRQGSYAALNFYFLDYLSGYLGYCYYPTTASTGSTAFYTDGCSILATTVPGGSAAPYNLGKTATHEAGHWFGLIHTFEDGCNVGDEVDDTPAQASASSGCPIGRDSCPNDPGLDPIHNYMDYSDDACYEEFTPGQIARAESMWARYRA